MKQKRSFNLRSFTSFSLVISTIIMSWSGFILYVAPPGRIANWGDWRLMLFTKAEWQALHTIFSYMFFILVIIHLFFVNWKTFLTYIRSKLKSGLNKKWELIAATIVSAVFFIGTLESWTPFGPVMTFGENVKASWDKKYSGPPVAHMEEYTLEKAAADFPGVTPDQLIKTLRDSSITVSDKNQTVKKIASENKTTPARIYGILTSRYKDQHVVNTKEAPSGVGRMTVKAIAERLGMKPEDMVKILLDNGLTATESTTMKEAADQMGVSPHDLYGILAGK
jgi:hypothetical protein